MSLLAGAPGFEPQAQQTDPIVALERTIAAAETSLREGELQRAESQYRAALFDAWMILGAVRAGAGQLGDAREAFLRASRSVVDARAAFRSLALVSLRSGNPSEAVTILTRLAGRQADVETDRLLAQALIANDQVPEAVQTLETAHTTAPNDLELSFLLASAYLRAKKPDNAGRLFAEIARARPGAETDVLVGRTYRDFGYHDRARVSLQRALKKDPRTRRAHYYLGTLAVLEEGVLRLDDAIREFQAELRVAPRDEVTNLRLGMALVEAQRPAAALPHLEIAAGSPGATADALHYLGRCLLALDRPADAVASLRRALTVASTAPVDEAKLRNIHYQLALALRQSGQDAEATKHFDEARRASARRAGAEREQLSLYLTDSPQPGAASGAALLPLDSPFESLPPAKRDEIERQLKTPIARAYLNLGVMHAQGQRFSRAAEFFEQAAQVNPDFPNVQYSLGVAYFNAQRYGQAAAPLTRALAADPANAGVRRMLALAFFNDEVYDKAVELLEGDAERESNLSLQYAYGLAFVRSGRAAEAIATFSRLFARHGDSPELQVVMGQAHAQQDDYDAAIAALTRALAMKPGVAEANTTLGIIYLKQGRLPEAATALKTELASHPADVTAQFTLATVLDLEGRTEEALRLLRPLLKAKPGHANARYLMGKILLAQGSASEAVDHLQAAVRLSPDAAHAHYQLGQAYQKLGRGELAEQEFALYRRLKDKKRGGMQ